LASATIRQPASALDFLPAARRSPLACSISRRRQRDIFFDLPRLESLLQRRRALGCARREGSRSILVEPVHRRRRALEARFNSSSLDTTLSPPRRGVSTGKAAGLSMTIASASTKRIRWSQH
jgi:hypothetical protein